MHEGLTCTVRVWQPPHLLRGRDIDLHVGNMKELSEPHEINDVHCETTDCTLFVLQQCKMGKFFIRIEN